MKELSFNVGAVQQFIKESANSFKAKVGGDVVADNKKNNEKFYKDTEKAVKSYADNLKPEPKRKLYDKPDANAPTLDYNPQNEVSKEYKDRIDAQAKGYTSKAEEKNGIEKAAQFDEDGQIKKQFADAADKKNKNKEILAHSGINGQNYPKTEKNTMYENAKPVAKRLKFKKTTFLNEAQMISKIPEEYKKDGQKIYMVDAADNEYIVECVKSEHSGLVETQVIGFENKTASAAQMNRINELFGYENEKPFAPMSNADKMNENKIFGDLMNLARQKTNN